MPEMALALGADLRQHFPVFLRRSGAIGRRTAARMRGHAYGVTIDGQSTSDHTCDDSRSHTLQQERVDAARVVDGVRERLTT